MADLMTGTYSTENLRRDNGGFMIPDFSIEADGKQIRRSSKSGTLFIDSVQLKLSADASGSLTFDVLNAYDLEARKFSDKVKEMLKPGNAVSAKFGYAGNLVEIFSGYIHSVNYEYNDTPTISVTAVDMIRLMRQRRRRTDLYRKILYGNLSGGDETLQLHLPFKKHKSRSAGGSGADAADSAERQRLLVRKGYALQVRMPGIFRSGGKSIFY